jgi:hypothetical protein
VWVIKRRYDKIGKIGKGGNSEAFKGIIVFNCTIYAPKCISLKGNVMTLALGSRPKQGLAKVQAKSEAR